MYKLEVKGVTHIYGAKTPFEKTALNDVSVGFEAGKITGLIGHTGSGKSTLVQMLNGLLRPLSGEILLDGEDIWSRPKEIGRVRRRVGLVMQYPEYQLFDETVRRDIGFALRNAGCSDAEIDERVTEAAECVGLEESLLDKSPFDLSGGQKRRAAIAGILAMRPEVLVLDEPAAGLDPRGRESIFQNILDYQRKSGTTVVIVSHSMEDMARLCDFLLVMEHGKVAMQGTPAEIFSRAERLSELGLDIPQITKLALLLRKNGLDISTGHYTVDGVCAEVLKLLKK
jgi:energy-coupling factor transport system ATP-binding protein